MATATVTVMFTDLVGSTALMSQVGEVAAEELRREHFALLRSAVVAANGREVKNLGDGLMVVFPSAADAVEAGVAVQRSFVRRNRRARHPLVVRVGIAVGDADVDDGDYFGVPVVQAARLCAVSDGGDVLCSSAVQLLGGGRTGVGFESVGELQLKGLDAPVPAVRLVWTADAVEDARPLPARLAMAVNERFVGREMEHQVLVDAWKGTGHDSTRRVVLVSGEPGIGKTTLTARFAHEVHDAGALVLYGRCDEDLGVPYQPWLEALGQIVDVAPTEVLVDHVQDRGAHLARWVPKLSQRTGVTEPAVSDGDGERVVLSACVVDLLERICVEQPVLLVLDDLHWADRQTVQLLRHVLTSTRPLRLLVAGTFRESDVSADHPVTGLLAVTHREQGVARVALRGLGDVELLAMLERAAGHEMDDAGLALRDAVLAETSGNPFFVGEILRHLAESGVIYTNDDGRWVGDTDIRTVGLPVSVKEVVGRRVAALGADTERLLTHASVIGRDFDLTLLAAVAGVDEDAVIDCCDAAVAASVLRTTGDTDRYTFAHALIEHTLYDGLSPARRARIHRAVAEAIESATGDRAGERAGELAHHWSAAVRPADADRALHYTQLAAERALDQFAPHDAMRWYQQALEHLDHAPVPDLGRRARLLVGLGTAQRFCGVAEHRTTLLAAADLADQIDDIDVLVDASLANTRSWQSDIGNLDVDRLRVLQRALDRLGPDGDPRHRAQLLVTIAVEQTFSAPIDTRLRLATEAIDEARRAGDPAVMARVLRLAIETSAQHPSTLELRDEWLEELTELAAVIESPFIRQGAMFFAIQSGLLRADRRSIDAGFEALDAMLDRTPDLVHRWQCRYHAVTAMIIRGDLDAAEAAAEATLNDGLDIGQPDALTIYGTQIVNIRHHQGRLGELVDLIEDARRSSPLLTVYDAVLAVALALGGEHERASMLIDAAHQSGFPAQQDPTWTTTLACWTHAAVGLGRADVADRLHDLLSPYPDVIVTTTTTVLPSVAHNLGQLDHLRGRLDEADAWFGRAETVHDGLDSPLLRAHNDTAWSALLADRALSDDLARARFLAERALDASTAGGFRYLEAHARQILTRC